VKSDEIQRWRRHVPLKSCWIFNGLHGVVSQKIVLFTTTAVRTSIPTLFSTFGVSIQYVVLKIECQDLEIFRFTWQAFLAAGAFTVTPKRKTLIKFTMPISIQTSTLLTARPGEVSRALIFMAPFSYDVS
jgi:hypothetical protein